MCCYPHGPAGWSDPRRDLLVYSRSAVLLESLTAFLSESELVRLQRVSCAAPDMAVFRQLNVQSSRKQVQPLVSEFYETLRAPLQEADLGHGLKHAL